MEDHYNLMELDEALAGTPFAGKLHYFSVIDSTNRQAMQEAAEGAPDGSVYLAEEQSSGRGRAGHRWHSASGNGLYMSVLLRPHLAPADALWISLAAGLAAREAVSRETHLEADIRWPNDLLLGGRKFAGILTELNAEATRVRYLVVGIGMNVRQQRFPGELEAEATSLEFETGESPPRQSLLVALLKSLHRESTALNLDAAAAAKSLVQRLEIASTWVRGKRVRVEEAGGYRGITAGLDERGFLRVRTASGMRTVLSGGVRAE